MPSKLIVFLFLLCCNASFAQNKKPGKTPPGTVRVNDTMFVDITEVGNIHWREYLYYLGKHDSANEIAARPDTSLWNNMANGDPMGEYYFRHPGFNDYPVVGVSYEQVLQYCQWRSDRVNELYDSLPENKRVFKKVTYRLLTKAEWESIAAGKLSVAKYPYGFDSTLKKWKGKYRKIFNCIYPGQVIDPLGDRAFYTTPLMSYYKNSSGVYNIIGNVAEMVHEKCIAKGGSFNHKLEQCGITVNQSYTRAEYWLGFRCVAIVEK